MKNFNIKGIVLKVGGGWGGLRQFADLGGEGDKPIKEGKAIPQRKRGG